MRRFVIVAMLALSVILTGCEKDGVGDTEASRYFAANPYDGGERVDSPLKILLPEEGTTKVNTGQIVSFKAWGGKKPYKWAVDDDSLAFIRQDGEKDATYIAMKKGSVMVVLWDADGHAQNRFVINQ